MASSSKTRCAGNLGRVSNAFGQARFRAVGIEWDVPRRRITEHTIKSETEREMTMGDWKLRLKALTIETDVAFHGAELTIWNLPYRIGRESRRQSIQLPPRLPDRRGNDSRPTNDLYIADPGPRLNISRQHLLFEERDSGIVLVDLFSSCGTIVEGRPIGGDHKGGETRLHDGDVVIIGAATSPFVFKVRLRSSG